jgi:hypothetical protein
MKKLAGVVVLAVGVAVLVFGVGRWSACSTGAAPTLDRLRDAAWLTRTLGLTEAQAVQVAALQKEYARELESCCSSHCAARMKLGELLFQSDADSPEIEAAVESMCKAQAASDRATLEHIRRVHHLLTPEQRERYERLVTGCVCAECPNRYQHSGS